MAETLRSLFRNFVIKLFTLYAVLSIVILTAQRGSVVENITENDGLPSNYIFSVTQDHNGFIWMGSDRGLIKYSSGKFHVFDADSGLPGNYINSIVADGKRGLLMYLSEKGLFYFDTDKHKVTVTYDYFGPKVPAATITRSYYYPEYFLFSVYGGKNIYAIHRDYLRKVHSLTPVKDTADPNNVKYMLKVNGKNLVLTQTKNIRTENKVFHGKNTYETRLGVGILRYENGKLMDTITEEKGLGSNLISGFMKKKNGDIYFGTFGGGISILKANNSRLSFELQDLKVRTINQQGSKYYLLSNGYLYILDRKELLAKTFLKRDALTMLVDNEDLYVGSFSGLDHYKIRNNTLHHIGNFPHTSGISKIRKYRGNILFSTYGGGVFELSGDAVKNYRNPAFNNIENLFQNYDGSFSITSYESGFSLLDKNLNFIRNYSKKDGLQSNNISFTYGEADTLWVGSKRGLSALVRGKVVQNFTENHGFIGSAVRIIFRSQKNELWLVTDKMILKKSGNKLKPLGSLNILGDKDNFISKSIYWKNLDELAIATGNNFSIINLSDIKPEENTNLPVLEKVISDKNHLKTNGVIKLSADNYLTELFFKPVDKNFLQRTVFFYRLNGGEWEQFKDPEKLTFQHLDYGKYEIEVKTRNSDGYESAIPEKIILKVKPHFYFSWWFILLTLLFLAALSALVWYIYYRNQFTEKLQQIEFQEKLEVERKRISRDLHDNIGAYTTSLIYKVDDMKLHAETDEERDKLDGIRENAAFIMSLLRQTIWVLSSKESSLDSFYDNIVNYVKKVLGPDPRLKVMFKSEIEDDRTIESSNAISLFRIVQESFHNVIKHSKATEAEIIFISNNKIKILIRDNGRGIQESERKGHGLRNMAERAQEIGFNFDIQSDKNGTTVILSEKD